MTLVSALNSLLLFKATSTKNDANIIVVSIGHEWIYKTCVTE